MKRSALPFVWGRYARVRLLTHEIGHTLGLGHCDLDRGAMCHTTSSTSNEQAEGTLFWTPQPNDILGLKAIYP